MNTERINEIFREIHLEENYNFLEDDLIILAKAYAEEGAKLERASCLEVARSVNHLVAQRIAEVRGQ